MKSATRFLALTALLFLAPLLHAQTVAKSSVFTWSGITAAGATTYLDITQSKSYDIPIKGDYQTVDAEIASGSNTVCTFQLEGSNDAVNWFSLSGSQSCLSATMFTVIQRPTRYVRINVLTYTGTASLTFNWLAR